MDTPRGNRLGGGHSPVRGNIVGIFRARCPVWSSRLLCFQSRLRRCLKGEALRLAPQGGAARGYLTGPFAARLWGCPSDVLEHALPIHSEPHDHRDVARKALSHEERDEEEDEEDHDKEEEEGVGGRKRIKMRTRKRRRMRWQSDN